MSFTNQPNGITSFGIPLFGSGARIANSAPSPSTQNYGRTWFVNAYAGRNGRRGNSPTDPFLTMAKAFSVLRSGDTINFVGKITEQLVTPVNVFDVTINGMGNRPRHADAVPSGGNFAAAQWGPPASGGVAAQATCRVLQQGWRFTNFLMTAVDTNAACLEIVRNAGATELERDASHAAVLGMRFAGAGVGIRGGATSFTEIPFNVEVAYSQFDGMTFAMRSTIECNQWFIHDNFFAGNTNQIIMVARAFLIKNNSLGAFTAAANLGGIRLTGATGLNQITGNNLSGTYSSAGGYSSAVAGDNWYGNASSAGFTAANPA
jgi:hypothetical protein